jgi:hypothetical protein
LGAGRNRPYCRRSRQERDKVSSFHDCYRNTITREGAS